MQLQPGPRQQVHITVVMAIGRIRGAEEVQGVFAETIAVHRRAETTCSTAASPIDGYNGNVITRAANSRDRGTLASRKPENAANSGIQG